MIYLLGQNLNSTKSNQDLISDLNTNSKLNQARENSGFVSNLNSYLDWESWWDFVPSNAPLKPVENQGKIQETNSDETQSNLENSDLNLQDNPKPEKHDNAQGERPSNTGNLATIPSKPPIQNPNPDNSQPLVHENSEAARTDF